MPATLAGIDTKRTVEGYIINEQGCLIFCDECWVVIGLQGWWLVISCAASWRGGSMNRIVGFVVVLLTLVFISECNAAAGKSYINPEYLGYGFSSVAVYVNNRGDVGGVA